MVSKVHFQPELYVYGRYTTMINMGGSTMEKSEFEKMLAEVDRALFDDIDEVNQVRLVNTERWEQYQNMVKALFAAQGKCGGKIIKIDYREYPDPQVEYAGAMIMLPKAFWFSGEGKDVLLMAAGMADRLTVTTNGDNIRASFTIDRIWME